LLPSAKCTRPLFQGRTGCGGRPSGWHDIVTYQRLVSVYFGNHWIATATQTQQHGVSNTKPHSTSLIVLRQPRTSPVDSDYTLCQSSQTSCAALLTQLTWSSVLAGPMTWNSLSADLRDPTCSAESFRRSLKTFLFAKYYCVQRIGGFSTTMRYINRHYLTICLSIYSNESEK